MWTECSSPAGIQSAWLAGTVQIEPAERTVITPCSAKISCARGWWCGLMTWFFGYELASAETVRGTRFAATTSALAPGRLASVGGFGRILGIVRRDGHSTLGDNCFMVNKPTQVLLNIGHAIDHMFL